MAQDMGQSTTKSYDEVAWGYIANKEPYIYRFEAYGHYSWEGVICGKRPLSTNSHYHLLMWIYPYINKVYDP